MAITYNKQNRNPLTIVGEEAIYVNCWRTDGRFTTATVQLVLQAGWAKNNLQVFTGGFCGLSHVCECCTSDGGFERTNSFV